MHLPKSAPSKAPSLIAVFVLGAFTLQACSSAPQNPAPVPDSQNDIKPLVIENETSEMPAAPWTITFADGSGNTFRFWQDLSTEAAQYKYEPVTMAESSSGTYSGGTAKAGELSPEETETIWTHVDTLRIDEALHTDSRMMGTGSFMVKSSGSAAHFIAKSGPELQKFMTILEQFRGK